jgi:hypothetical protein
VRAERDAASGWRFRGEHYRGAHQDRDPDLDQLARGKFNSFRRIRTSNVCANASRRRKPPLRCKPLLRRDELEPAARVELFEELTDFRAKVEFRKPPTASDVAIRPQRRGHRVLRERKTAELGPKPNPAALVTNTH